MELEQIIEKLKAAICAIQNGDRIVVAGFPTNAVKIEVKSWLELLNETIAAFELLHQQYIDEARKALVLEAERENLEDGYRAGLVTADVPENKAGNSAWMMGWRSGRYFSVVENLVRTARRSEVRRVLYAARSEEPQS